MAEILVKFDEPIPTSAGKKYLARAIGRERKEDNLWEGSLEFLPLDGEGEGQGETLRSGRETTQPNRKAVEYWAQGLTRVYLMGALDRTASTARRPENQAFENRAP
jgi:hypothetical protein